jgi:membrane protease YdiL (CAAX protease family)
VAAVSLLQPPLSWLSTKSGHPIRTDGYAALLGAFVATVIMLRSIDRRAWSAIDFSAPAARGRVLIVGWMAGALPITLAFAVLLATGLLHFVPSSDNASWWGATLRTTLVLLPASLSEELITRGYLLTVIRENVGTRAAVVGTSIAFGLLHLANPSATAISLFVVILAGVFLATVRLALKSLWAAWMAHLAWNWMMAVVLHASVSGIEFQSPGYKAVTAGPAWLSGGEWGPEGGLVAALGLVAGLTYFYARHRREES